MKNKLVRDLQLPGAGRNRAIWMGIIIRQIKMRGFKARRPQSQVAILNPVVDEIIDALDAAYTMGVRDGNKSR